MRAAGELRYETAATWHAGGGLVVGMLGWSAPRELVAAAGMLPVRLSADRLAGLGDGTAFGRELTPATAGLAAALLSGALDWIDFLVIGRDREDYTRLFYVLRELRRSGAAPHLIPVAFFDLLRLPSRTSARYNRQRAAELVKVIAGWAGRPVTPANLADAVEVSTDIARLLRVTQELRTRPHPAIAGSEALAAALAASALPVGQLRQLLDATLAAASGQQASPRSVTGHDPAARVFLAGSGTDDLTVYEALEALGIAVVGEDHEWGDDGSEYPQATRDPLDGIVDRYQFAHGGAARAGLHDRVRCTAARIRAAAADGVLYLLGPHDEAVGWELPALTEHLGGGIPLVAVRLPDPGEDSDAGRAALSQAGRRLLTALGSAATASEAAEAGHG